MSGRPKVRRRCSPPARSRTSWSTTMPGPPFRDFRELSREDMIKGVLGNMVVGDRADPEGHRPDDASASSAASSTSRRARVKLPIPGLDLSSGARAGLHGVPRRRRAHRSRTPTSPSTSILPGIFETDRWRSGPMRHREEARHDSEDERAARRRRHPGQAHRPAPTSSARPARSCARRMPATSPARAC